MHVETGISLADFARLDGHDMERLERAVAARWRAEARRDANLYALLCTLACHGKKTFKAEDFMGPDDEGNGTQPDPEKAAAALEAYRKATGG